VIWIAILTAFWGLFLAASAGHAIINSDERLTKVFLLIGAISLTIIAMRLCYMAGAEHMDVCAIEVD